jgi:hypothetical protein
MKKLLLSIIVSTTLFACATQGTKSEKQPIGFDMSGGEGKTDLYGGNPANVAIIESFFKALNDRDTASIRNLEASENLKLYTPEGNLVASADSNIKHLSDWFTSNNPKWKLNFSAANSYTDKSGKLNEWVTTGAQLTQTIDGKEVKYNQYFDVNLVNGKIQRMYVTERKMTVGE